MVSLGIENIKQNSNKLDFLIIQQSEFINYESFILSIKLACVTESWI